MSEKINENIIDKVIEGLASPEEVKLVVSWFNTDEGQAYLSNRMDREFYLDKDLLETVEAQVGDIPSEDIYERIEKQLFKKKVLKVFSYAAAILLPLIFIYTVYTKIDTHVGLFGDNEYTEIYVPKGEKLYIAFQDGSTAYLNSDTKLRYPKKFGFFDRKVYLDGEAYFTVEKNKSRPFIVELDSVSINVLGTSFNLEAYKADNEISLKLDEGKVNLQPHSTKKEYALNPGEKLIYSKKDGHCSILSKDTYVSPGSWKDDIIYLEDKSLLEVLNVLERKYNQNFEVKDPEILDYRFTILIGKSRTINQVLLDLERIAPVKFGKEGEVITVRMNK